MQFVLLFLLAVTGPTVLDQPLSEYRSLISQATLAETESTSQSVKIRELSSRLSERVSLFSDPVWQETYFLINHRDSKDVLIPTPESVYTRIPPLTLGMEYFLLGDDKVTILNKWLFSESQVKSARQEPQKPQLFRGDSCWAQEGYYKPLKRFEGNIIVEFRPYYFSWSEGYDTLLDCPPGTIFEIEESAFLSQIKYSRERGSVGFINASEEDAERLTEALNAHRAEVLRQRHANMIYNFIDTQMAKEATQP